MLTKLKYTLLVLMYILVTYLVIWGLQNRQWLECKLSFAKPPVFKSEPFEWKGTGLVTLWFDDNWSSQYYNAFPIMREFGFKGVIAVITSTVCTPNYLSWPQIYRLEENGWEMVSHSKFHTCDPYVLENSPQLLVEETSVAKKELEEHNIFTNIFVTPCGYSAYLYPKVNKAILGSYSMVRIAESSINHLPLNNNPFLRSYFIDDSVPMATIKEAIENAKKESGWIIITFHQVGLEYPYSLNVSKEHFREVLELVKQSGLPVVLPSQVINAMPKPLISSMFSLSIENRGLV